MLKRVLFGAVEGCNYQGRPRKPWVDDILKWCDMTLQQASHHAQDRVKWKNLIAGPTVLEPRDKKKKKKIPLLYPVFYYL